jgi:hypothetical protein
MLDSYGRDSFDDSRDYIISQALFKRDNEFARWVEQQRNANNNAERMVSRTDSAGIAPRTDLSERKREASSHRNCGPGAKRISLAEWRIAS